MKKYPLLPVGPRRAETIGQPSSPPHAIAATGAAVAFSEWHISDARDSTGYLQQILLRQVRQLVLII